MVEETKHDLFLKRTQITIAILAGLTTLIIGVYNVNKSVLAKSGAGELSLTVRSDGGGRLEGAMVEIFNAQNAIVAASETALDGSFEKKGLEAGSYILKITRKGFEPEAATVQVDPKRVTELKLALREIVRPVETPPNTPNPQAPVSQDAPPPSKIQSALEDVGASWIKKLTASDSQTSGSGTTAQ